MTTWSVGNQPASSLREPWHAWVNGTASASDVVVPSETSAAALPRRRESDKRARAVPEGRYRRQEDRPLAAVESLDASVGRQQACEERDPPNTWRRSKCAARGGQRASSPDLPGYSDFDCEAAFLNGATPQSVEVEFITRPKTGGGIRPGGRPGLRDGGKPPNGGGRTWLSAASTFHTPLLRCRSREARDRATLAGRRPFPCGSGASWLQARQ